MFEISKKLKLDFLNALKSIKKLAKFGLKY